MSATIEVQFACKTPRLASKQKVRTWAGEVLRGHSGEHEVTVRIVDEAEGAELNQTFRQRDGATNVLSFAFETPPVTDAPRLGDIAVCAPIVKREASEQGKTLEAHCAHLVVHGALHLLGYNHQNREEAEQMESEEVAILARLGYSDPYAAGS